jgi:hypothetical protein
MHILEFPSNSLKSKHQLGEGDEREEMLLKLSDLSLELDLLLD